MQIQGDSQRPIDPATRKRQADAAAKSDAKAGQGAAPAGDHADVVASPGEIARYVQILKAMNPVDLHRVENLRARIKDGSYTADPQQLAGPLADHLDQGGGNGSNGDDAKSG